MRFRFIVCQELTKKVVIMDEIFFLDINLLNKQGDTCFVDVAVISDGFKISSKGIVPGARC